MKPRLRKMGRVWICVGGGLACWGETPAGAYDCWHYVTCGGRAA